MVVPQGPKVEEQATEAAAAGECADEVGQCRPHRIGWARLLKRVFDIDMPHCSNFGGGELKIIAAILGRPVIGRILTHLGLDPQPPPRAPARESVEHCASSAALPHGRRGEASRRVGRTLSASGSTARLRVP
jgi:hypothetical protein